MEILNLTESDWDIAIILDACRHDSFKSIYDEYLDGGRLDKVIGASCTTEWLRHVFKSEYPETVYVSGNPWMNSITSWDGFQPKEKFKDIIDVWNWGWDEEFETVPPGKVTKAALEAREKYSEERLIIHYLQPHYPYLNKKIPSGVKMHFDGVDGRDGKSNGLFSSFNEFVFQNLEKTLGRSRTWKFRNFLSLGTDSIEEYLWRTHTPNQLRQLYRENLRLVLTEVEKLLNHLNGKIIITSDHGEALGEEGEFFHPLGTTNKTVREVPYWESKPKP